MAAAVGTAGGAVTVLTGAALGGARLARWLHDVHTAVMGEPERTVAGVTLPAVPGFGEHLNRQDARLAAVEWQFNPDHGGSLRDAMDRVEAAVALHVAAPADTAHPQAPAPVSSGASD